MGHPHPLPSRMSLPRPLPSCIGRPHAAMRTCRSMTVMTRVVVALSMESQPGGEERLTLRKGCAAPSAPSAEGVPRPANLGGSTRRGA